MGYLLVSILCTTLIFIVFRFIGIYKVNTFQAIVANYWACVLLGVLFQLPQGWEAFNHLPILFFLIGSAIGCFFVAVFFFMGKTTQNFGVSPATITARMSLVIPAIYSVIRYDEPLGMIKILGIVTALAAIVLTLFDRGQLKEEELVVSNKKLYLLPLGAFLGTGLVDSLFKTAQVSFLSAELNRPFLIGLFGVSAVIGSAVMLLKVCLQNVQWEKKSMKWGLLLGTVNYFAIFFLLLALTKSNIGGSVLFPINSVSIVALSTLASYIIFRERLNFLNKIGFGLSILAIVLIYVA